MLEDPRLADAFRSALNRAADEVVPVTLEVPQMHPRRWLPVLAAAAVLVLFAAGAATAALWSHGDARSRAPYAARPGWHWVSRYDAELQVPNSWHWGIPVDQPPCGGSHVPAAPAAAQTPYVAVDTTGMTIATVGCVTTPPRAAGAPAAFGNLPFGLWRPNLRLEPAAGGATRATVGVWRYRGWRLEVRKVGHAYVRLLTAPGRDRIGSQILASAHVFGVDANGCPATSPAQDRAGVDTPAAQLPQAPGAVSICQYVRTLSHHSPALVGSRLLRGAAARGLVAAVHAAPLGTGPDAPGDCVPGQGEHGVTLVARTGGHAVTSYVDYDSCVGNGIRGGGVVRQLTTADCKPIFAGYPITLWQASSGVWGVCAASVGPRQ